MVFSSRLICQTNYRPNPPQTARFDFLNQTDFVKHIYLAISECLKDENVNINDIRHTNYLEHYTFSQGNEVVIFKINYNGQNKITTIQKPANSTEFTESIYTKLVKLQNKIIIIAEPETNETEFEFEQSFLLLSSNSIFSNRKDSAKV